MLLQTQCGSAQLGGNYLFKGIAAVCLGGVGLNNGRGKISNMIIGTVSIILIIFMLTSMGALYRFETIIEGIIIVLALYAGKFKRTENTLPSSDSNPIESH